MLTSRKPQRRYYRAQNFGDIVWRYPRGGDHDGLAHVHLRISLVISVENPGRKLILTIDSASDTILTSGRPTSRSRWQSCLHLGVHYSLQVQTCRYDLFSVRKRFHFPCPLLTTKYLPAFSLAPFSTSQSSTPWICSFFFPPSSRRLRGLLLCPTTSSFLNASCSASRPMVCSCTPSAVSSRIDTRGCTLVVSMDWMLRTKCSCERRVLSSCVSSSVDDGGGKAERRNKCRKV